MNWFIYLLRLFFCFSVDVDRQTCHQSYEQADIHYHFISTKTHDSTTAEDSYGVRELRDGCQMCDLAEVNPGATLSGGMTPLSSQSNPALFCPTSYNTLIPPNVSLQTPAWFFMLLPTPSLSPLFCNSQDKPILSLLLLRTEPLPGPAPNQSPFLDAALLDRI